jgi:hypothetical protein
MLQSSSLRLSGSGLSTTFQLKKSEESVGPATAKPSVGDGAPVTAPRKFVVAKKSDGPVRSAPVDNITGPLPDEDPMIVQKRKEDDSDLEEQFSVGSAPTTKKKKLRSSVGSNECVPFV